MHIENRQVQDTHYSRNKYEKLTKPYRKPNNTFYEEFGFVGKIKKRKAISKTIIKSLSKIIRKVKQSNKYKQSNKHKQSNKYKQSKRSKKNLKRVKQKK